MLLIPAWVFAPGTHCSLPAISHAIHGARRMGSGAGAFKTNFHRVSFREHSPELAYQLGNFRGCYAAQQQAWLADHCSRRDGNPNYA